MIRIFAQIFLATSLLQFFPADIGIVEPYISGSNTLVEERVDIQAAVNALSRSLPNSENKDQGPIKTQPNSLGIVTSSVSAVVVDVKSGAILFEKNGLEARSIGSITKLMSALVFLDNQSDLAVSASLASEDIRVGGRNYFSIGDVITVKDLFFGSLIGSDNSATMSLVRLSGLGLDGFVAKMNDKAEELGMISSTFSDPTGLSPDNRSTVYDIVALLKATESYPLIREAMQQSQSTTIGTSGISYTIPSTNSLLDEFINKPPYKILAGKTGFLPEAGYCLGVELQKEGAGEIFVVVLGAESAADRFRDVRGLSVWAFETFDWSKTSKIGDL